MKGKILTVIYLLLVVAVVYWSFPIFKERYFTKQESENSPEHEVKSENFEDSEDNFSEEAEKDDFTDALQEDNSYLEITKEDCANRCADFKEIPDIEYCKNVCGLSSFSSEKPASETAKEITQEECDGLGDLKKDYCLKESAISKKDFSICEKISDTTIQESCNNRLTEEIMNGGGHADE